MRRAHSEIGHGRSDLSSRSTFYLHSLLLMLSSCRSYVWEIRNVQKCTRVIFQNKFNLPPKSTTRTCCRGRCEEIIPRYKQYSSALLRLASDVILAVKIHLGAGRKCSSLLCSIQEFDQRWTISSPLEHRDCARCRECLLPSHPLPFCSMSLNPRPVEDSGALLHYDVCMCVCVSYSAA